MNLSNLLILLFTFIASTTAAALIAGIDENEVIQLQAESLAVEEPSKDVLGEHLPNVNKRSIFHPDSHRHRFAGPRRHSYHRHRYHPHTRYSSSYTNSQMNSPAAYTAGKRFLSHRYNHRHHLLHHGHGHRPSCNRHQVTTEGPSGQETTTTKEDRDRIREDIIESIFKNNDSKTWDNLLEPITDSPLESTTNSKGLLYDIDLRSSF